MNVMGTQATVSYNPSKSVKKSGQVGKLSGLVGKLSGQVEKLSGLVG